MHSPLPVLGRGEPERYESPAQVASDLNVSLLGALARADGEWTPPLVLPDLIDPEAPYDAVADRIELLAGQMPLKLLGCIGLGDDPLRYRLAANLAARLARTGARVTLVEAELHAPLLQPDRSRREGLVDMLLYGCSFGAVARDSGIPGVKVVGAGSHLWSGEPIHGDEWERVLGALRAGSDYTLVTTTTGLPAPILGMLIRRLDSIVIAYALERASREAVRRSYLSLWDMDAPILGLVTEGPHLAGSPRIPAADRPAAQPAPARKPEAAPPAVGADWASRLLGEPLAPGMSPMTEEVEVVIRQTSEVDAAAAALWEKEVERLRSILTAPDGVTPFLDAEAPPPAASVESELDREWPLDDRSPAPIADEGASATAEEPMPAATSEPDADDTLVQPAAEDAPEIPPALQRTGRVQDWSAAIGAEIAAWGAATPADEPRPASSNIPGLERITIVAEDTFFAGARAAQNPPPVDRQDPPPPPVTPVEEPAGAPDEDEEPRPTAPESPWMSPPPPPQVQFAEETPPVSNAGPRSEVASAAEEAANWFARLDSALSATPPVPPIAPAPPVSPLNLGPPPIESAPPPIDLGARMTFEATAPEPVEPLRIERLAPPEPMAPEPMALESADLAEEPTSALEPLEPSAPPLPILPVEPEPPVQARRGQPVEPTPAEAAFPWHQPETAAEDEDEVAFWPSAARTSDPLAAPGGMSNDDLAIIHDIEQELVGAAAAAPVAVADEPPPSRTPWRVLVIGGLVGLAAVGLWAYQSGMIRLEPPPPRQSSVLQDEGAPAAPPPAAETHAPASNSAPAPPAPEAGSTTADAGSQPETAAPATAAKAEPAAAKGAGPAAGKSAVATSGMGLDTAMGSQALPKSAALVDTKAAPAPPPASTRPAAPETRAPAPSSTAGKSATPPPATTTKSSPPSTRSTPAAPTPGSDVKLVGETPAGYGVHVSSFKTESVAQNDLARFQALGYPGILVAVEVPGRGIWRRVVLGPYSSPSEAEAMAAAVRAAGLSEKAQAMRLKP